MPFTSSRLTDTQAEVVPVQYEPDCPFKYNNFVYRATFNAPPSPPHDSPLQPGCMALPDGTTDLIVRLTNPDAEGNVVYQWVEHISGSNTS